MTELTNSNEQDREAPLPEWRADEPTENAPGFSIGDRCALLLIFAGVGLAICCFVYRPLVKASGTANWPSTTGTIIKSSYSTTQTAPTSVTRCRPKVQYSYSLPNEQCTFTSHTQRFGFYF